MLTSISELNELAASIPPTLSPRSEPDQRNAANTRGEISAPAPSGHNVIKKTKPIKWLVGTALVVAAVFVITSWGSINFDQKLYKEVSANAFGSGEEFDMYVEKFYRDLAFYGVFPQRPKSQTIRFSTLDEIKHATHYHGVSYGYDDDSSIEIYINPSTWESFDKPMRYFLMYHELAHDVLNIDDLSNSASNSGDLMYPELSSYENKTMDDFIEASTEMIERHVGN